MTFASIFLPTLIGASILAIVGFGIGALIGWVLWHRDLAESRELIERIRSLKEELSVLKKR